MGHESAFEVWYKNGGYLVLVGLSGGLMWAGLSAGIEFFILTGGMVAVATLAFEFLGISG